LVVVAAVSVWVTRGPSTEADTAVSTAGVNETWSQAHSRKAVIIWICRCYNLG